MKVPGPSACRLLCLFLFLSAAFVSLRPAGGADAPDKKPADNPALQAAAALYEGIRTETLPNGLRVYLKPIPGSPVVTTARLRVVGMPSACIASLMMYSRSIGPSAARPSPRRENRVCPAPFS